MLNPTLPTIEPSSELSTYAYSYPHKSSYRPLSPPVPIAAAWHDEDVSQLSLYVHIPFCEMRCGFCNLFTQSLPGADIVDAYLQTLQRQMRVIREAVPQATFHQLALGGGTPTFLTSDQLRTLLTQLETTFDQPIRELHASVEVSPSTATADRLHVLSQFGVERISIGVQSFITTETQQIGRPQRTTQVYEALDRIRDSGFPSLNIDLIYGDPQQSEVTWLASLREALQYDPDELYLYPLYVRPQTGLSRASRHNYKHRHDLYLAARDLLCERGYVQASLRCFRLPKVATSTNSGCQRDGMIGLGCGARSYTRRLHYATRFAVTQAGVRAILGDWIAQSDEELSHATHGMWLSDAEQLRRYLILSLLQAEGMSISEFEQRFPPGVIDEMPELVDLRSRGWLERLGDRYVLTPAGLQHSDTVGPLLYSTAVRDRLRDFVEFPKNAEGT